MTTPFAVASFVSRPAAAVIGLVLLGILGALLYAGPGAASVAYTLIIDGGLTLAWLAAAYGVGVWPMRLLARRLASGQSSPLLECVSSIAIGLGLMSLAILGLGLAGIFSFPSAIGILAVGWGLGIAAMIKRPQLRVPPRALPVDYWHWLLLAVAPLLAVAIIAAMFPPGFLWKPEEPNSYDATVYHLQVPREWFEAGRITPLRHNVYSYFPFGVEMHYLLAIYLKGSPQERGGAWHAMYLSQLMHLAMTALAVVATAGFAARLTSRRSVVALATLAMAGIPLLAQVGPLAFNDGALLLYATLSIGWTMLLIRRETEEKTEPTSSLAFVLPGLLAGFSAGVKLTGVPLLVLAVPTAIVVALARRSFKRAVSGAMVFGVSATVVFSPWLIRNIVWCGNPVFPEGMAMFGKAHFSEAQVERWEHAHAAQPDQQSIAARFAAFGSQVLINWQFGLTIPIGVAAFVFARRRRDAHFLGVVLLLHAVFWLGFTHLQGRFFLAAAPAAALLITGVPWDRGSFKQQRVAIYTTAALLALTAIVGWYMVHDRLTDRLSKLTFDRGGDARGAILANDQMDWMGLQSVYANFPFDDPDVEVLAVGDAQAFLYSLPMSRVHYRTPFDVPEGPETDVFQAYGANSRGTHTWVRVDSDELIRFNNTYQPFPSVPQALRERNVRTNLPYVVPPGRPLISGASAAELPARNDR